ncbi:MAG: aminopeptidase N [Betaproteobacteria bacterium]|nr:aminopeptidase N [Betaproteobacteria bacterium]MCL2161979.1 aminopeptidase N [Betaproteobacteria bacterium]
MNTRTERKAPVTVHRADYRPLAWVVERVELHFRLDPQATIVTNRMVCARNPGAGDGPLRLWGEGLERLSMQVDGQSASPREVDDGSVLELDLEPPQADARVTVEVVTRISPEANTTLSGLYLSNNGFFTQCEAEGFRRITFFPDRPDVMARYTVTVEARRESCPVLLSNGNLVEEGDLADGWHFARWEDPFPKPSYLFALVAAKLAVQECVVKTASGRQVLLQVWVEDNDLGCAGHAMTSLIHAMRWDEERFGLELDLDRFMIVAVSDFNMGAMENKGLNIFNAKFVLARPETASDADYADVESVVAHEYFHNWTGNRVTCRDWFQLTLKEGLTVFRDQEFSADMLARAAGKKGAASARAVKRIDDVRRLRAAQFPEDNGPMAHPIRPDSYQEIDNFYTATVYEKGAEVIRMLNTLLGTEGFRAGMNLYFRRHDGRAVTCDDFVAAMSDANGTDLTAFMRWYAQAGTPRLKAQGRWDAANARYDLTLSQRVPATIGQPGETLPLVIPVAVGLIAPNGRDLPLRLEEGEEPSADEAVFTRVLTLDEAEKTFRFTGIEVDPVPSILRGFSAPVILELEEDEARLAFLMANDSDPFNRWDAAQRYSERVILARAADPHRETPTAWIDAFRALLDDERLDPAFRAEALALPSERYLLERMNPADPIALRAALIHLIRELGSALAEDCHELTHILRVSGPYRYHPLDAGRRALTNMTLRYLVAGGDARGVSLALARFATADNMTEYMGALGALMTSADEAARSAALDTFRKRFSGQNLALDKWFALQAGAWRWSARARPTLDGVRELMQDSAFNLSNPNKVYALFGAFFHGNPGEFHAGDGSGHAFWADQVCALDARNPQIAARLARALEHWRHYPSDLQASIRAQLERVRAQPGLSNGVTEVIDKALN